MEKRVRVSLNFHRNSKELYIIAAFDFQTFDFQTSTVSEKFWVGEKSGNCPTDSDTN